MYWSGRWKKKKGKGKKSEEKGVSVEKTAKKKKPTKKTCKKCGDDHPLDYNNCPKCGKKLIEE